MEVPCASLGKERVFQIEGKAIVKTGVGACLEYSRNIREMSVAGRGSRSEKSGQQGLGGAKSWQLFGPLQGLWLSSKSHGDLLESCGTDR